MSSPHVADANCRARDAIAMQCIGYACMQADGVYSIHTSRPVQRAYRASWLHRACMRSRASEASSNCPPPRSSRRISLRRMLAACFCMREGASVAQKCQNAKCKPPWLTILAQSATCMWRNKVSIITLRISSFQFCMFYLCATIISYGKITVYIENLTNLVLTSWNPVKFFQDFASLQPQYTVRMKYIF